MTIRSGRLPCSSAVRIQFSIKKPRARSRMSKPGEKLTEGPLVIEKIEDLDTHIGRVECGRDRDLIKKTNGSLIRGQSHVKAVSRVEIFHVAQHHLGLADEIIRGRLRHIEETSTKAGITQYGRLLDLRRIRRSPLLRRREAPCIEQVTRRRVTKQTCADTSDGLFLTEISTMLRIDFEFQLFCYIRSTKGYQTCDQ